MTTHPAHSKKGNHPTLILASGSAARKAMLEQAGLDFSIHPASIDEALLSQQADTPEAKARLLAREKALHVSREFKDAPVIGSDQILCLGQEIFSKAKDTNDALEKLRRLSGKTHRLISAVAVARNGEVLWDYQDFADLSMRALDEEFLARYAERAGDALTSCVGGYQIEGAGAWLFDAVKGDFFTIMGMPLLALLGYLYEEHRIGP
ncbi:MAG: septum formation protein Maf [Alphaproteobacteria bacterium]|nr:septum formation protein Maf [Alphaproteobacteria bacterium]